MSESRKLADILDDYGRILWGIDEAAGEVTEEIEASLAAVEVEMEAKVAAILGLGASLEAGAAAERERSKRIAEHARAMEARAERLRAWVTSELDARGVSSYQAGDWKMSKRIGPPKVEIADEQALTFALLSDHPSAVRQTTTIDKREVLAILKSGEELAGAHMVRGEFWQVK